MNKRYNGFNGIGTKTVKSILFIDDCDDTNFLHNEYVKMVNENLNVTSIRYASKVIPYLKEAYCSNLFPNLIFMDINLPLMDGFEILEAYQNQNFHLKCPQTAIYMLSTIEHSKDKKKLEKFPFVSGHLIKPLDDSMLVKILSEFRQLKKVSI